MTNRILHIASILLVALSAGSSVHATITDADVVPEQPAPHRFLRRLELQDLPCTTELRPVLCGTDGAFHYNLCQAIKSGYAEEECREENAASSSSSPAAAADNLPSSPEEMAERRLKCGKRNRPVRCDDMEFLNYCQAKELAGFARNQCVRIPPFPDRQRHLLR